MAAPYRSPATRTWVPHSGGISLANGTLATSADVTSSRNFTLDGAGTIATAGGTTATLNGQFTGAGALTKAGGGTLLLTADSSGHTGANSIAAGTLAVTGKLGGAMTVDSGARLEGTGSVGAVTNAGTVAPGRDGLRHAHHRWLYRGGRQA